MSEPRSHLHRPKRDDDVAAWLKRMRDSYPHTDKGESPGYRIVDGLLDRYRECADYGLTLRPEDDERGDP